MMRNTHHATSRRIGSGNCDRSTPARQVPSWQNAPRELRRDTPLGEARQPHRFRHTRPQAFQRPRVAAAAGRFHPVDRGRCAPAGHEPDPVRSSSARRHDSPAVTPPLGDRPQLGVLGDVRVRVQRGLHVDCPSRRLTTCTGTPDNSSAVAWECRIQCGVQACGTCPASWRRSRSTRS